MSAVPNEVVCQSIGREYVEHEFNSNQDCVRRAYRTMAHINEHLFSAIPVPVEFTKEDPYADYTDMKESVEKTGVFKVFAGGSGTKYLSHEENCKGRAVHDWYGHLEADCNFTFEGECRKWFHVCKVKGYYPKECHRVMLAEVVGQVAACHYLPDGFGDTRFRQRPIEAPQEWKDMVLENVI